MGTLIIVVSASFIINLCLNVSDYSQDFGIKTAGDFAKALLYKSPRANIFLTDAEAQRMIEEVKEK